MDHTRACTLTAPTSAILVVEKRWHYTRNLWFDIAPAAVRLLTRLGAGDALRMIRAPAADNLELGDTSTPAATVRCSALERFLSTVLALSGVPVVHGAQVDPVCRRTSGDAHARAGVGVEHHIGGALPTVNVTVTCPRTYGPDILHTVPVHVNHLVASDGAGSVVRDMANISFDPVPAVNIVSREDAASGFLVPPWDSEGLWVETNQTVQRTILLRLQPGQDGTLCIPSSEILMDAASRAAHVQARARWRRYVGHVPRT